MGLRVISKMIIYEKANAVIHAPRAFIEKIRVNRFSSNETNKTVNYIIKITRLNVTRYAL